MESFYTQLITTRSTERKILILEMLSNAHTELNKIELSTNLKISNKTLNLDIAELRSLSETKYIHDNKGLFSLLPNSEKLIIEITQILIQREPLFRILIAYFNNEVFSLSEWSDKLYVVERTLERYLKKLKSLANEYKLKLKYNPISFTGSEVNIRLFFYDFLTSSTAINYPTTTSEKEIYNSIINYVQNETTLYPTVKIDNAIYWIMIIKKKIQGKHYVLFTKKILNNETISEENMGYYHKIWNLINLTLPEYAQNSEFKFMTIIYHHQTYYNTDITFNYLNEYNYDTELFFLELIKTFDIHYSLRLKMYHSYKSYIFNIQNLTLLSPLFQKNSPDLNKYIKKKFRNYFNQVEQLFTEYTTPLINKQLIYLDDIIVNLTLIVASYTTQLPRTKKLGFFLDGNINFVLLIQTKIKQIIPAHIEIYFFSYEDISITLLNSTAIDIFITNNGYMYSKVIDYNIKTILIKNYPTESDLIKLVTQLTMQDW